MREMFDLGLGLDRLGDRRRRRCRLGRPVEL